MNERLKFSWGHIIAFLAMIFVTYITFTGAVYKFDTDWTKASLWAIGTFIVLFGVFVGVQQLKSTEHNFSKCILWERLLAVITVLLMIGLFFTPYSHFWTVYSQKAEIEKEFHTVIDSSKAIFDEYESFVEMRMNVLNQQPYKNMETREAYRQWEKLQLQPIIQGENGFNYEDKKKEALDWINNAKEASVWNVFMLGNLDNIKTGVQNWKDELERRSKDTIHEKVNGVFTSHFDIQASFDALKKKYSESNGSSVWALVWALVWIIICYGCLLFPWVIQERPIKNPYTLLGVRKSDKEQNNEINIESKSDSSSRILYV
ncbi:MAG: hypothetical protein K5860_10725 [Bacteroidales bacterium]|nr:hypothetical protein [Bacteroidales bacterium]